MRSYALDWDNYGGGRAEQIQIVDAASSTVLDTRTISSFTQGIYLVWNISGNVKINITLTGGGNTVISGVFFKHRRRSQRESAERNLGGRASAAVRSAGVGHFE